MDQKSRTRLKQGKSVLPAFQVTVTFDACALAPSPFDLMREVHAQNAKHAAASGLSLAGCQRADVITVRALQPVRGRPVTTIFSLCERGVYGFCYAACCAGEE